MHANYSITAPRLAISLVLTFLFTTVWDGVVHGVLLADSYAATASLWRTPEAMNAVFPLSFAQHILMSLVFVLLYTQWRSKATLGAFTGPDCHVRKSMVFGLLVGILLGTNAAAEYIYLPVSATLAIYWGLAEGIKWIFAATVLSIFLNRTASKG